MNFGNGSSNLTQPWMLLVGHNRLGEDVLEHVELLHLLVLDDLAHGVVCGVEEPLLLLRASVEQLREYRPVNEKVIFWCPVLSTF